MKVDDGGRSIEFALCLLHADDVVEAVRDEVGRLLGDPWQDPKHMSRRYSVADRPAWWWRMRLVEWATSQKVRRSLEVSALAAFRSFLRDLPDRDLCFFIRSLLPRADELADSA